ncbi:small acid-soluble spore protein Tlp [Aneurinibacillus aneurinilyticus]|jgi:small acid-soluble spore protein (thioredoxin-like protein)|uniref:Small acid-soluble spore protein Tlp n=2 Tax=Aneurinibacillus aneurinilyticus TaxID=1391 RepID=A0A848CYG6_ANEAE|nr:small acid-soluble spore protein Tlp [Aneurinibacillus aneurinilyticus]ERI09322.1 small, acid-soluble spore protein tlp [Aneurinibacillus aneurinilyticus ATCC 12856]MCI1694614.1 small acid-soluble spore protein Tlp [Aneurinibacillus aneurinilyticus]MED0672204.1 small acid-soluble spore protein Tlp [Aneurinibacillus aneurinilyticus]MED0704687.1 small acid-soluble spore protein Tlp [Aneurinibacillus aneurinilyticus]MED0723995.1 small acid-soluble spore protein Tlp [Aneurinibacillus aneurinily
MAKPKPDNRKDNAQKLKEMVQNTIGNIEAAEETMSNTHLSDTQRQQIREKNERRRASIDSMRSEIKDEAQAQQNRYE